MMDHRAGPCLGEVSRFRNILPRPGPSEDASKTAESHGGLPVPVPVQDQNNFTDAPHSVLQGDVGATYVDGHAEPLPAYDTNNLLQNVETHLGPAWAAQLQPPGLGTQADQGDLFLCGPSISMDPTELSYGMTQLPFGAKSFASPPYPWTGPPFAQSGGASFPSADACGQFDGSQEYLDFASTTRDAPLQSDRLWANSSALVENPPEAFGQIDSSFREQTVPYGSTRPHKDVNVMEDFLDFSGSQRGENWQLLPSEPFEADVNALGASLENRSAEFDCDDFSMFFDAATPTKRLGPNLAAVLLGIPEHPSVITRDEELQFSYETRSRHDNDISTGATQSPDTLQASESASSPTLTKVSSHRSSVTLTLEQVISTHGIESSQLQSEGEETRSSTAVEDIRRSVDSSSKEDDLSVQWPLLRTVLPLLPPPADFSHTNIVVKAPSDHSSVVVEKYLKLASEAKQQGESKLATALPSLTSPPLAGPSLKQKRARSPREDPIDLSDRESCKNFDEAESEADVLPPSALASSPLFSRKKRGKLSIQQRVSTARIRKLGACLRCGILKEKCSDSVPCERCVEVAGSKQTTFNIPCWRSKLGDIELFRRRTQHGLFVYTYTKQSDSLHARAVRIFDPEKLKQSRRQQVPFTCQKALIIETLRPLKYLSSHLLLPHDENGRLLQYACTIKQLEKGKVIATYLDRQMKPVLNALGTGHQFVHLTLDIAERYSQSPDRKMLRNSLRIFTARFLRRKFWVSTPDEASYDVAWMDVPWRAMPVLPPKTPAEAETLNKILKDFLFGLEKSIIRDFKAKVYARNREDWFELFLVTFIFQVVLSEKLEMSFYTNIKGVDSALEMPWSTFGGLRSYSSQAIAAHFRAIKGSLPFHLPRRDRAALGKLGDLENRYLDACPNVLKDSMLKKDDLGSRRSSSSGHGGTPGSWWQWAIETVLDSDTPD